MPENPNIDPESGSAYMYNERADTMATSSSNNNNRKQQQTVPRVSSAGLQYYDIATQLLGKNGSDLEELFIAAARDGVYERIENFLQRNRSEYVLSIDVKDKKTGNTPLIWAAKRGHAKIVQLLLRHSADITLRNYEGQTAVEVASPSIRAILLDSVERGTEASHHLLLQAAWQGDIKVVSRLLTQKKVLDINCQNADGFTPIMLATRDMILFERLSTQMSRPYNPVEVVTELISARADLHAGDGDGKTCLHHAAQSKASIAHSVVSTIISGGPNLECKDKRCFTSIHCAALTGNSDCILRLLDGGSEVNSRGFAGATPLHITSYNNHEKATEVLLGYGGNVTLTDDRGLTPLDFAKTRKMKKKLHEAWTDTKAKSTTNLGPIRAPSREDLRTSVEDLTVKRRKGEVIFDGVPANPFSDSNKKDAIARSKGITRHLSLKEKANKGEDDVFSHSHNDGVRRLGQVRSQRPTPLPRTKSRSTERLPAISPDRLSDRNLESPVLLNRSSRNRRSFEDKKQAKTNRGGRYAPLSTREGSNLDGRLTPTHKRSDSDPNRSTPNLRDLAASCEPYLQAAPRRGRSYSMTSNPANDLTTPDPSRQTPIQRENTQPSVQREVTLMSVCSYRSDSRMSTNSTSPRILNLGQMLVKSKTPIQNGVLYGPGSSKVIPPTPTFITQVPHRYNRGSESDSSPRSDDDIDAYKDQLGLPETLQRTRTIFKDEFILEDSRPKTPFYISSSGSGSDTVSSSGSSHLSSPRESPFIMNSKQKPASMKPIKLNSVQGTSNRGKAVVNKNVTNANSIMTSISISRPKISEKPENAKSVPTAKRNSNAPGINVNRNSAQNVKGDTSGVDTNGSNTVGKTKETSFISAMAKKSETQANSTKPKTKSDKSEGSIQVHSDLSQLNESTAKDNKDNDSTINDKPNDNVANVKTGKFEVVDPKCSSNGSNAKTSNTATKENKTKEPVTNKRVVSQTQKIKKNVLQVQPTKLTENIIRSSGKIPQDKLENNSKTVTEKAEDAQTSKQTDSVQVNNVNIKLPKTAGVVNRVSNQAGSNADSKTTLQSDKQNENSGVDIQNKKTENESENKSKPTTQSKENNLIHKSQDQSKAKTAIGQSASNKPQTQTQATSNSNVNQLQSVTKTQTQLNMREGGNKTPNVTNVNRTAIQSASERAKSRQGANSRNSNINVSKSAGAENRQTRTVKKTISGYTPRFQSNTLKDKTGDVKQTSNVSVDKTPDDASKDKLTIQTNIKTDNNITPPAMSGSPTELVPPSVCKTSSLSKSYNMASGPTASKSSTNSSNVPTVSFSTNLDNKSALKSPTSATSKPLANQGNTPNTSQNKSKQNSVLSKSTSETLAGSAKVTSIVSKSVSQMPFVGTVQQTDKTPTKTLIRSSSMSIIDETKEKKLMSSSDTKIECQNSSKRRPASDGPAGTTSTNEKCETQSGVSTSPLVEILPDCAPRISRKNYMDSNTAHTAPVIVNPFEELEQTREKENLQKYGRSVTATDFGFVVEKPTNERSKTLINIKSKAVKSVKKNTSNKPSSASSRVSSGKGRKVRSKDSGKNSDSESRPKSGSKRKRVKSGKRKKKTADDVLAKENEKSDVALIGGIGWQMATSCLDKTDVDAVMVSQIDSSDSESEAFDVSEIVPPLNLEPTSAHHLQIPNAVDTPSSVSTPRFREVLPNFENSKNKQNLQYVDDDGYPPMNLDMTQNSNPQLNRSGVIIDKNIPDDISDFLAHLKDADNNFDNIEDYIGDDDDSYGSDNSESFQETDNDLEQQFYIGKLTPIPESPALTQTSASLRHVAKTVNAINRFDENMKEGDLNKLLGVTPRDRNSNSFVDYSSHVGSSGQSSSRSNSLRTSGGSLRSSAKDVKLSQSNNGSQSGSRSSRNNSSKTNQSNKSQSGDLSNKVVTVSKKDSPTPQTNVVNNSLKHSLRKSGSFEKSKNRNEKSSEKYEVKQQTESELTDLSTSANSNKTNTLTKDSNKKIDLKQLLAEKMQSTKKMLEEASNASLKSRTRKVSPESTLIGKTSKSNMEDNQSDNEDDVFDLTLDTKRLETFKSDDDAKSTISSRRERRFSETKNHVQDDDVINEAIDEIMSNTFPSCRSSMKSHNSINNSYRSNSSTLTDADRKVLVKLSEENKASPFHAKGSARASSDYDSATLNRDNPHLMERFHAEQFKMGQKVKAMLDAGADTARVKAMMKSDNETKQLQRIMNSFKQMELYAGPHSSNNRTPRRAGEGGDMKSLARQDSHPVVGSSRPDSAGGGRQRTGKFTEIKEGKSQSAHQPRPLSPSAVPKDLAAEFKRSPYVQVGSHHDSDYVQLNGTVQAVSSDSEEDSLERPDSACTSLSSNSSIIEDTIQWKKGNVLGKGAFGTVWCGLTSEGQLIAVKQIELNTSNKHKAKKEYEKVQEEVELLKTLEHKNIVGYLGTSLEDSIVSIFMQFVPGGSIASILARFGALDEAVFRKYTRQILEGVDYLHNNDVIHRDIKGGNVMLMPNGVIKLIDFGCAKRLCINLSMGQSEILKSMKGTPYWMAPEVVNETGHGKKSDIWSIGCTVFEMATRKPPWADMNPMAAIFAIGSDKPVPQLPDRFTEEAHHFINSCLSKDQIKRLSAAELLQTPFIRRRSKKLSSTTASNC